TFEGTVIVVSHDRYFLNRVVDLLVVLDGEGGSEVVYGNYDTYELLRQARANAAASTSGRRETAAPETTTVAADKQKRKRKFPFRKVPDLEADIAKTETKIASLEEALQSADVYRDPAKLRQTMADLESNKDSLAKLYQHWE